MCRYLNQKIGFYPIVDSFEWVQKLIPLGISTIQLRIKNHPADFIDDQIKKSVQLAKQHNCQLFINDYWQLAVKHDAFGVHLGQEDLTSANVNLIHHHDIYLGISTHNGSEINRALTFDPSYLAYGPIYHTSSKPMSMKPRGVNRLCYWVDAINLPIVAIGGITIARSEGIARSGVGGIAVMSGLTEAPDYKHTTHQYMQRFHKHQVLPA